MEYLYGIGAMWLLYLVLLVMIFIAPIFIWYNVKVLNKKTDRTNLLLQQINDVISRIQVDEE